MTGKKKMPTWAIVLLIVLGLGVVGGVVCCGGGFLAMKFGTEQIAQVARGSVEGHPAVVEHIGEIWAFELSLAKSGEIGEPNTFVFDVHGNKGSGEIVVRMSQQPDESGNLTLLEGELELPDGTVIDLVE